MVVVFLEDGFEDIEALGTVDILRRAGIEVKTISSKEFVESKSKIIIKPDLTQNDPETEKILEQAQCLILPGGMPGVQNLKMQKLVLDTIIEFNKNKKWVAAICAAPTILSELGVLENINATSYPSLEKEIHCKKYLQEPVVVDDKVITSRGAGTTHLFAKKIVELLVNKQTAEKVIKSMVY